MVIEVNHPLLGVQLLTNKLPEHAIKINIWAFCFVLGPYAGPFISSWLLIKLGWVADMGVLAGFYGFSTLLVILIGQETLYDREKERVPTAGASRIALLTGVAGVKATGLPRMMDVFKHLFELAICPQLLLPCLFVCIQFMWAIGIGEFDPLCQGMLFHWNSWGRGGCFENIC